MCFFCLLCLLCFVKIGNCDNSVILCSSQDFSVVVYFNPTPKTRLCFIGPINRFTLKNITNYNNRHGKAIPTPCVGEINSAPTALLVSSDSGEHKGSCENHIEYGDVIYFTKLCSCFNAQVYSTEASTLFDEEPELEQKHCYDDECQDNQCDERDLLTRCLDLCNGELKTSFDSIAHLLKSVHSYGSRILDFDLSKLVMSMVTFGYQLYTGSSLSSYVGSALQFILSISSRLENALSIAKKFVVENFSRIKEWVLKVGQTFRYQKGLDFIQVILTSVLSNPFAISFRDMVLSLVSARIFKKDHTRSIIRLLGPPKKMCLIEVFATVIDGIANMVKFASRLMRGESFLDIWNADDPLEFFIKECEELLEFKDYLIRGVAQQGYMLYTEFRNKAADLLKCSAELLKAQNPFCPSLKKAKLLVKELENCCIHVDRSIRSLERLSPFAFILSGKPGIGKSHLMQLLYEVYGKVKGRKHSPDYVFTRVKTSQYMEGYIPYAHPIISYLELGNQSANLARSHGDHLLSEIQGLIDTNPYPVDMAFDDKGKVYAVPELIAIDTNNKDLHMDKIMFSVGAMKRRFLYIDVDVQPQFRHGKGSGIDKDASLSAGGNLLDRYVFTCTRYVPLGNKGASSEELLTTNSIVEFVSFFEDYLTKFYEDQKKMTNRNLSSFIYENDMEEKGYDMDDSPLLFPLSYESESGVLLDNQSELLKDAWSYGILILNSALIYFACCFYKDFLGKSSKPEKVVKAWLWCLPVVVSVFFLVSNYLFFLSFTVIFPLLIYGLCRSLGLDKIGRLNDMGLTFAKGHAAKHINHLIFGTPYNPFIIPSWNSISLAFLSISAVFATFKIYKKWTAVKMASESSTFLFGDSSSAAINKAEEVINAGRSRARVRVKNKENLWNVAKLNFAKPVHNGSSIELYKGVKRNVRFGVVVTPKARRPTHIFGVVGQYAIINRHAMAGCDNFDLDLYPGGVFTEQGTPNSIHVPKAAIFPFRDDLCLIRLQGLRFTDVRHHFIDGETPSLFSGCVVGREVSMQRFSGFVEVNDAYAPDKRIVISNYISYKSKYIDSMCGVPLIGEISRSGVAIVGIHCAGASQALSRIGVVVTRKNIDVALSYLRSESMLFEPYSEGYLKSESLVLPSQKSPFRFEHLPAITYFGKTDKPVFINNRSRLTPSCFVHQLDNFFQEEFKFTPDEHYVVPNMRPRMDGDEYISPWNVCLNKMNVTPPTLDQALLERIVSEFSSHVVDGIINRVGDISLHPLDVEVALNGDIDDQFLRRINASTSGGYGYGDKHKFIPFSHDDHREPIEDLKKRLLEIFSCYNEQNCSNSIFGTSLKDEPRLRAKNDAGKVRVFYMSPLDNLLVARMFLAPFYTLMVEHDDLFCTSVGINALSGFDKLRKDLVSFGNGKIMEGDYSGFDVSNPFGISLAANTVIERVLERFGYNEEAMVLLRGVLSDALFPLIHMNGDMFVKPGMQPSGRYGTAEDNSLRGVLMQMYIFYTIKEHEHLNFFDHVLPRVYGDDYLTAVSSEVESSFDNLIYQDKCMQHFKMKVTPAHKDDRMTSFVSPDNMSYLRRTFVYVPEHDKFVGKLNMNSIYKSLQWRLPSQFESPQDQEFSTLRSALWELFCHCRSEVQFDRVSRKLFDIFISQYDFPEPELIFSALPNYHDIEPRIFSTESGDLSGRIDDILSDIEVKQPDTLYTGRELAMYTNLYSNPNIDVRNLRRAIAPYDDYEATRKYLNRLRRIATQPAFYTESGDLSSGLVNEANTVSNQNIDDIMGAQEEKINYSSRSLDNGQGTVLELGEFFSRPVEIANFALPLSTNVGVSYPVWDLYTLQESVRAKLRNYAFLRADLCVRIMVSGSPFHAGRLMISYQPASNRNANLTVLESSANYRQLLLNYLSQSPECGVMDVKANKPLMIKCPYISTKPAFRLFNSSTGVISAATSYADCEEAGRLYVYTLNQVTAVSASPSVPYVQIVAWMENVQLGCPTATQIEIQTESGDLDEKEEKKDEFESGPIEKIASSAVQVSDALTVVPFIAPFAKASAFVFKGIAAFSSIFGWSRPPIVCDPIFVKNRPFANGAQTIGASTIKRITIDPKQEVSIDPSPCGTIKDDMIIAQLAARESYFSTFNWAPTDAILSGSIFRCRVHPQLDTIYRGLTKDFYQPTALSFASTPFRVWRGDIVFRFDFVVSAYHRGRVIVYYEPNIGQEALIDLDIDLNKQWIQIIDIQETQSVELCVEWNAVRPWMRVMPAADSIFNEEVFSVNSDYQVVNGYIGVAVLNELQSPDDSTIDVNVFVKGQNMQYNALVQDMMPTERIYTESGDLENKSDELVSCMTLNPSSADSFWISDMYFGEEPISFRGMMKRYVQTRTITVAPGIAANITAVATMNIYPPVVPAYGGTTTNPTLYSYLRYAYLGVKGGIRKRVRAIGSGAFDSPYLRATLSLEPYGSGTGETFVWSNSPAQTTQRGTVSFVPHTNGGMEAEFPYYSTNLYSYSFADDLVGDNPTDDMSEEWFRRYRADFECDDPTIATIMFIEETAAAEDFMFMRFMGAPFFSSNPVV